jgi:single-strand selective monofunctional uracil DNA glycosylase
MNHPTNALVELARELAEVVDDLSFSSPVAYVYNPLNYARRPYEIYLNRYGRGKKQVLFVGMNPGPWGMAQTGVPFGDVGMVRDWLGIQAEVENPPRSHPSRPVLGFACPRGEVSGRRLWGLMRSRFGDAETFFRDHFVANYCPLLFLEEGGRNLTPDRIPARHRGRLYSVCDAHLLGTIEALEPDWVVGIGRFTEKRTSLVVAGMEGRSIGTGGILHPSPANPQANRNWEQTVVGQLTCQGVWRSSHH